MEIRIGQNIKSLRKAKNISQEVLAQYLGVSFQAVSKWETGATLPDVATIPAIASFFEVSTDELFDFNILEMEKKVGEICDAAYRFRGKDDARSEQILRDGLKQFPGNDIILNNLLYTMRAPERAQEVIDLCTVLIESTRLDDVKYDALRILAETYKEQGEYALCKATIERIPEIYFTKLELDAQLLEGEDMFHSAWAQKGLSAESLVEMALRLADYYEEKGDTARARSQLELICRVTEALKDDITEDEGKRPFWEYWGEQMHRTATERLAKL